ncbi:hypothetical protein EIK77_003078 [Talaromyces pinophilus]|nr:hypothetical protein EIK77_003078 [Talaromyces pinophilus]
MSLVAGVSARLLTKIYDLPTHFVQAFEFHNSTTPDASMTTAMPGGQEPQESEIPAAITKTGPRRRPLNPSQEGSICVTTELLSLLPPRETAALLVDTYFDRIHWFMLIFHQQDFRQKWPMLYDTPLEDIVAANPNPAIISTFLVVIAIALQYTGKYRQHLLETQNVNPTALKDKIFYTIRSRLLDIVATGSLEAVQTCVLLGTYYLFHGSPNLAWPVCGCGLRIAQALNLHRKSPTSELIISPEAQRKIETRKRCWWAIYEIETFCSISYGYPHGIVDADCNVEFLDPLATSPGRSPASYNVIHQCPATLLSYKYLMSKLSVFLKDVSTDLYGIGSHQSRGSTSLDLKALLRKVSLLDDRLQKWKAEIPDNLRLTQSTTPPPVYSSAEEMDRDIGASGPGFESHVYQLQALALLLAYENARILVHRPLLTYRTTFVGREPGSTIRSNPSEKTTSHLSLQACRDAAMNTSNLAESPIFSLAADTYAAAFISIHTFTAGVMLCVLASIEPLTPASLHCKMGLRRLLNMQAHLKSKAQSPLPAQGLEILERLTRLVMEKELKDILSHRTGSDSNTQTAQALSEDQSNSQLDMIDNEAAQRGITPDYVQDTTISQALFDLDQGMHPFPSPKSFELLSDAVHSTF